MHQAKRERGGRGDAKSSPGRSVGVRDFDVKLVELAVEGVSADIERLGDIAHVPAMLFEQLEQNLALVGLDRVEFGRQVVAARVVGAESAAGVGSTPSPARARLWRSGRSGGVLMSDLRCSP